MDINQAYDFLKKVKGLEHSTIFKPLSRKLKMYKSKKSFEAGESHTSIVAFPSNLASCWTNIEFAKSIGCNSYYDFFVWLRSAGYSQYLEKAFLASDNYHKPVWDGDNWRAFHGDWKKYPKSHTLFTIHIAHPTEEGSENPAPKHFLTPSSSSEDKYNLDSMYDEGYHMVIYIEDKTGTGVAPKYEAPHWTAALNGYKFTPDKLKTLSLGNEFFSQRYGIEIEVATNLSPADLQHIVTMVDPVQEPFFYHKWDGSIKKPPEFNNKFEIVTFPCSMKYLRKQFKILFEKLERMDLLQHFHTNDSCGLHIHIDKESFFDHTHLLKFGLVWNSFDSKNMDFIQRVGKRPFNEYCQPFQAGIGQTVARRFKTGIFAPGHNNARRACCRQTNVTLEVRIFKGGFSYEHIMYCLEAVYAMHQFTDKMPIRLISHRSFEEEFMSWLDEQTSMKYFKEGLKQCA